MKTPVSYRIIEHKSYAHTDARVYYYYTIQKKVRFLGFSFWSTLEETISMGLDGSVEVPITYKTLDEAKSRISCLMDIGETTSKIVFETTQHN